jgi:outer membrane immunogenic protein
VDYEEAFMRRHLFAVLVACVSIAGATGAALSDGAPSYDYAPSYTPAPQGWRGFYLGAHLGGTWGSSEATDAGGTTTLNDSWSASPSGVVAGGTLGYNWQLGPMIYGIEGDLGYLGLAGSGGYYVPFGYDASTTTDTGFYLTMRGRLGVLVNGWMLYFTGGYLGADTTVSVLESCDIFCTTPAVSASSSSFRNGWTIGGGFETALEGAWTAKLEYLYYDLGAVSFTTPPGGTIGANTWNVETDGSLIRAGINYRFNSFKIGY